MTAPKRGNAAGWAILLALASLLIFCCVPVAVMSR